MAKKKKAAEKAPKTELPLGDAPGVGRTSIPEIDAAAAKYVRIRNRRQDLTKDEVEAKDELKSLVKEHADKIGRSSIDQGLHYVFEDNQSSTGYSVVDLTPMDEQLKVSKWSDPGAPAE